jgi:hypothetical protein
MRRRNESGFALLLIFLMAALLALSLYKEIPRVAFETQRQKEELLVERGEQYKRAIKLFVSPKGIGHWPAKIEDLENTNNRRFLRHRYVDPFTGKADWRLVHVQNGVLTDSVVNKLKNPADQKDASSGAAQSSVSALSGVTALPGAGGAESNAGQPNLNPALRRRASEGGANPGMIGPDGQPIVGTTLNGQPYPSGQPPYPDPSTPSLGGQVPPTPDTGAPSAPGIPGSSVPGNQTGQFPGMPGPPVSSQTQGVSPTPYPPQFGPQGQSPFPQPGLQVANPAQQAAAASIINDLLMKPNPRGLAGVQNMQGNTLGSGIAGVASTVESDSIMMYNDHEKYNEWEFVYDPTKERPLPNPNGGAVSPQVGATTFAPGPAPGGAGATMQPAPVASPTTMPGNKQ